MNKQEILKKILDYINSEKAKYTVLIDGPWRSGKTHLYKNYLAKEIACVEAGKNQKRQMRIYPYMVFLQSKNYLRNCLQITCLMLSVMEAN